MLTKQQLDDGILETIHNESEISHIKVIWPIICTSFLRMKRLRAMSNKLMTIVINRKFYEEKDEKFLFNGVKADMVEWLYKEMEVRENIFN